MSVIVYGPQGSGKNRHAEALRAFYRCSRVIESDEHIALNAYRDWGPQFKALNVLVLTDEDPPAHLKDNRRVIAISDALRDLQQKGPK